MHRTFTLVELMIVVAIIAILAAIAIPAFVAMQYKAKLAEVPVNGNGWQTQLRVYCNETPTAGTAGEPTMDCGGSACPDDFPGKSLRNWPTTSGFDYLAWRPDGGVRCSYKGDLSGLGIVCDVDGNSVPATWFEAPIIGCAGIAGTSPTGWTTSSGVY